MLTAPIENKTRKEIILALKKHGSLTVDGLSREIGITPMGIRQHLLVLERNGIVEYGTKKQGVGRPGFLYRLTREGDDLFKKSYAEFSLDVLGGIEDVGGREKIDEIFSMRKDRLREEREKHFLGSTTLGDRVSRMAEVLQREGAMVDVEETDRAFKIKQFNCPILKIASRYSEACMYDLRLLQELIGSDDVTRTQSIADGAPACLFEIPKN